MYISLYSCTCRIIGIAELQVIFVMNFLFSDLWMHTLSRYFHAGIEGNHKNHQAGNRNRSLPNTHLEGSKYTSLLDRRPFILLLNFSFPILLLLWLLFHLLFFLYSNFTFLHLLLLIFIPSLTPVLLFLHLILIPHLLCDTSRSWHYSPPFPQTSHAPKVLRTRNLMHQSLSSSRLFVLLVPSVAFIFEFTSFMDDISNTIFISSTCILSNCVQNFTFGRKFVKYPAAVFYMIELPLLSKGVALAKTCNISIFEHHCLPILEKQNFKSVRNDFDIHKHFLPICALGFNWVSHWELRGEKSVLKMVYCDSISCILLSIVFTIGLIHTNRLEQFRFLPMALRPNAGQGLLILEVSKSHTTTHHIQ